LYAAQILDQLALLDCAASICRRFVRVNCIPVCRGALPRTIRQVNVHILSYVARKVFFCAGGWKSVMVLLDASQFEQFRCRCGWIFVDNDVLAEDACDFFFVQTAAGKVSRAVFADIGPEVYL
jgi:hypothetical protein